jgi:hypothetical protein
MGSYISSAHKFDIGAQMVMEEHVPLYLLLLFPESGIIMHGKIADENGEYLVGVKYCYGMSQKTCESDLKVLKRNIEIDINDLQILW